MEAKDYYKILNLDKKASTGQIKQVGRFYCIYIWDWGYFFNAFVRLFFYASHMLWCFKRVLEV